MDTEQGSQRIIVGGRDATIIARNGGRVLARFDDGGERWVALVLIESEKASAPLLQRELGS